MAEHINVFLGEHVLQLQTAAQGQSWAALANWQEVLARATEHLERLGNRRTNLNVAVGGSLCRPFLFPERASVSSWSGAQRLADHLGPTRTALPAGSRAWIDPDSKSPFGTVLHAAFADAVLSKIGTFGRIRQLTPWWADVQWQALREQPGLDILGVHDDACLTILAGTASELTHASSLIPVGAQGAAQAAWSRALTAIEVSSNTARYAELGTTLGGGHQGLPYIRAQWIGARS